MPIVLWLVQVTDPEPPQYAEQAAVKLLFLIANLPHSWKPHETPGQVPNGSQHLGI